MKAGWIIAGAAAQGLALAWMAGEREYVAHTGQAVRLRTAPIDPRDAMRGDYVRLQYDFSFVPKARLRDALTNATATPNRALVTDAAVYAQLQPGDDGVAQLVALSDRRPGGLFLRGRVESASAAGVSVRYGVEAYFMEQGRAAELERRPLPTYEVPLEMEARVGASGMTVLTGYRWSPLGLGLDLETKEVETKQPAAAGMARARQVVGAKVRLINATTNRPIAVITAPEAFGLMVDNRWSEERWSWVGRASPVPPLRTSDVVVLQPGQVQAVSLRFTDPAWFVVRTTNQVGGPVAEPKGPVALGEAAPAWGLRLRVEYAPPDAAACRAVPGGDQVWHGRLPSRAFGPAGIGD